MEQGAQWRVSLGVGGADVVHAVGGAGLEVARVDGPGGAREAEGPAVVTHDERVGTLGARVPGMVETVVVVRAARAWVGREKRGRQNGYYTPYEGPNLANQKSRKLEGSHFQLHHYFDEY